MVNDIFMKERILMELRNIFKQNYWIYCLKLIKMSKFCFNLIFKVYIL